ncbi:MAG: ribonuclease R [Mariprofundaceae bacterium]
MSRKKNSSQEHGEKQHKRAAKASPWDTLGKKDSRAKEKGNSGRNKSQHARGAGKSSGECFTGIVSAHPDGFGFVDVADREKGLFLPRQQMRGLMHGDEVEVRNCLVRGRESAELVRIIKKAPSVIVGQFIFKGGVALVQPRSKRMPQTILVHSKDAQGAQDGDWVRIDIERSEHPLHGRVLDILGQNLDPASLIDLIVAELQLPDDFPSAVHRQAETISEQISAADMQDRLDLRHLPFVTIDGEDARDFDDAICVQPRGDGFEAWVAIADVSHYVQPDSAMDTEALERSNSFYFPDRVIPMLPELLSNGLCSLNPHVDRLAMVVRMRFDVTGRKRTARMYAAVIHSQARLTYTQASIWLQSRDAGAIPESELRDMLDNAARLHAKLADKRKQRGALDLDVPEVRAILHEGRLTGMGSGERNIAHHLIEEMMLAANTSVAEYMHAHRCPLLYRVHPAPKRKSLEKLNDFLAPFGLFVCMPKAADKEKTVQSSDVQFVLKNAADKPFAHPLQRLVLRSMQQARYTTENEGHFGLAYDCYCHFTSPIRRYADLTVHRRLKALISKQSPDKVQPVSGLAAIGEQTSQQERKQQRGEWDVQAMLAALYHCKDVGEILPGRISGLTQRRMFFELEMTLAEAALPTDTLDGAFELDESTQRLVSKRNQMAYQLGDAVHLRIESSDPVRGMINVSIVDSPLSDIEQ